MIIDEDIYLEHFGVKGMKWGVIRQKYRDHNAKNAQKNADFQKKIAKMNPNAINNQAARDTQNRADRAKRWAKGKPTRGDKAHRAISAAFMTALGGVVVASIIANNKQVRVNHIPKYKMPSAAEVIRNEHATQLSSLTRMHKEGKMDAEQFKNFSEKLAKRYARKLDEVV